MTSATTLHLPTREPARITGCRGGASWGLLGLLLAAAVLLGAVAFLLRGPVERKAKFTGKVADLVPAAGDLPGWRVKDAAIAETPEIQRQVDELLNFDDAVFRIYEKDGLRLSVYLAYWRPGKMQAKDIGRHTPDVCWVAAGWERTLKDTLTDLHLRNGARVPMTEHRIFVAQGQPEHVVFWHVVDEAAHSYQTGGRPPWYWILTDTLRWGLNQKPEQFFLRISSNRPVSTFWENEIVQGVIGKVPGIAQPHK